MAGSSRKVLGDEIAAMFNDDNFFKTLMNFIRVELEEKLEASLYCRKGEISDLLKEIVSPPNEKNKGEDGKQEEEGENKESKDETTEDKVKLSDELATLVGQSSTTQSEAARKIFEIIKEKGLRDPQDIKYVICDDALMKVIGVKRFEAVDTMKYLKNHFINEICQAPGNFVASTSEGSSSSGTPMVTKDVAEMFGVISKEDLHREIAAISNGRSEEEECGTGLASPNTAEPNNIAPIMAAPNKVVPNMKTSNMSAPDMTAPNTVIRNTAESNIAALNEAARKISERNMETRDIVAPNKVAPNTGPFNMVVPKTIIPLTLPPIILPVNVTASNVEPSNVVASNMVAPNTMDPKTLATDFNVPNIATELTLKSFRVPQNVLAPNVTTPNVTAPNVTAPNVTAPNNTSSNLTTPSMTSTNTNRGEAEVPDIETATSSASPCCHVT